MAPNPPADGVATAERWDRAFRVLASEPRRQLLLSLLDAPGDERVTLPDAAEPSDRFVDREGLCVELRHNHLPQLSQAGYVTWTADPFVAERGPAFEEVGAVLETLVAEADRLPEQLVEGCATLEDASSFE